MKVKCFECGAQLDADTADAAVSAFVAHARDSHTWTYPDEAIRNYARNYAEATERLTGDTERLAEVHGVTVQPATEDRIDDWLQFFDHDAFADSPGWASCYCLEPHAPAPPAQPERPWRDTRASMADRLRCGKTVGYLAYVGARGASWIEGYPHNKPGDGDAAHFRGPRSMYEERGFQPVEARERHTVMRRAVT